MKKVLYILITVILTTACTKGADDGPSPLPPVITLDSETSIYTTKTGREIEIRPSYENADNAVFSWRLDSEQIGEGRTLKFSSDKTGRYYITITATNEGGQDEEELRIDVLDLTPPTISLPGAEKGFTVLLGSELELHPGIASSLETSFVWTVDGREVSTESDYTFSATDKGRYTLGLSTHNEDGEDAIEFTVEVKSADEIGFVWQFEQTEYNVSQGRTIRLRAIDVENAFTAVYTWTVDGEQVQQGIKPEYVFSAAEKGRHTVKLEMQNEYLLATKTLTVNVCEAEGAYYRPGGGNAACNKVFEFLAAPGQFVNENYSADDMAQACTYAEGRLAQTAYVSLGAFGGYIVVGFDHSIDNDGDYNIAVTGNAFDGSSEPGIVWVMQDENGDGLPNDTWYELKGSEYGKDETIQDYAITYYRPSSVATAVQWTDNCGGRGQVDHLGAFHKQEYYYPSWVKEDSYTLRGTCLKSRSYDASGNGSYWVNPAFDWGYADNLSPIDRLTDDDNYNAAPADNHFKISNAVTFDGRSANLKYIDFVKIQVGLNEKCGWLGEVSTEVFGVKDFNMSKDKAAKGKRRN